MVVSIMVVRAVMGGNIEAAAGRVKMVQVAASPSQRSNGIVYSRRPFPTIN